MKSALSYLSLFILVLTFPAQTEAQNFGQTISLQANCYVEGGRIGRCEACNFSYYQPVYCQMNIQGQTSYGYYFQGFQQGWVQSGQCIRGNVFARNPYRDPLVFANANVFCRF